MAEAARVLVVDDEPGITDLVSMALRYEGLKVEVAHTGWDALRTVTTFRPHLMVLDIMLPDLDGFEVLRRLSGDHPRIPVLFLTARDGLDDKLRGFTLGGDDYVTKPFSVEELIVRTRAILRRVHEIEEDSGTLRCSDLALDEDRLTFLQVLGNLLAEVAPHNDAMPFCAALVFTVLFPEGLRGD